MENLFLKYTRVPYPTPPSIFRRSEVGFNVDQENGLLDRARVA